MEQQPLPFATLIDISKQTLTIHHDKLYAGYIAKSNEIQDRLVRLLGTDLTATNQSYSELRSLKADETFAVNGAYLHEWYFNNLGGNGKPEGMIVDALTKTFGSFQNFVSFFSACGMAARGWVVLCWDLHDETLRIYNGDTHNQGGVWGCLPILVLDVYEHAYFIDKGSDRKAYIEAWWKNITWSAVEARYQKILKMI